MTPLISLEAEYQLLLPKKFQLLSPRHFTPVSVAKKVADFLCDDSSLKVLDIGSGVGKLCHIGAQRYEQCEFYGIEIRKDLVKLSQNISKELNLKNTFFICEDIARINFLDYDRFYFFNSFQEKIDDTATMDRHSEVSVKDYLDYAELVFNKFLHLPLNTKIALFHTPDFFIPRGYVECKKSNNQQLKFLQKQKSYKTDLFDRSRAKEHAEKVMGMY